MQKSIISGLARHLKIHQAPGSGEHKGKTQPKDFACCVSVEEYASHLLVSKVTAGLMTDDNNPKSAMVMLV